MTVHRRPVHFSPAVRLRTSESVQSAELVRHFHQNLKGYQKSPLVPLKEVAEEIGVHAVYVKDETNRFRLSAFLGASWATFRALTHRLKLPPDSGFEVVRARLAEQPVSLYVATQGDHGRGVARFGALLSIPVQVHVSSDLSAEIIALIKGEGAIVIQSKGSYSAALVEARAECHKENGVLVQEEVAAGGHEEIPQVSFETF